MVGAGPIFSLGGPNHKTASFSLQAIILQICSADLHGMNKMTTRQNLYFQAFCLPKPVRRKELIYSSTQSFRFSSVSNIF